MDIIFAVVGEIVVEHHFNIIDVNAASCDIGRDQELKVGTAKAGHDPVPHRLAHATMETVSGIALGVEVFRQVIHHLLGIAKDDTQLEIVDINQAGQEFDFKAPIDFVVMLFDGGDGHCRLLDPNAFGVLGKTLNQVLNGPGERRREENGLPCLRQGFQYELDVFPEAHVEHDIRFIQDDHFDLVEAQSSTPHMVHDPPWCTDDDLGSLLQPHQLSVIRLSSVNWERVHAALEQRQLVNLLRDLDGQFTGGTKDQNLDGPHLWLDLFDGRNGKGGGFPRTGLGLAHQIVALEQQGNGFGLNRRGLLVPEFIDGFQDLGRESQFRKQFGGHAIVRLDKGKSN